MIYDSPGAASIISDSAFCQSTLVLVTVQTCPV